MKLSPNLNLPIPEGSDIHNLTNFVVLLNAIDNNAAPLGTMNNHINNKNNPHAVTKAQVGLSQVNNVPQYSKGEIDSKLTDLSKLTQLPADSVPSTGTPASFPIGITVMTVTTGYPGATTNSPKTVMTVRGSNDRGTYQLLSGNGTPQQRAYDGVAWGGWSTVATTASNVASATKLANARKIGGVNFDGTSDITLPGVNAPGNQPTSGKAATAGRADTATHADAATAANKLATPRKIGGVTFDGTADVALPGVDTIGNQDTTGKAATAGRADSSGIADTANKLTTARKIGGVSFDGSADVSLPGVNAPGNQNTSGIARAAVRADTAGIADVANKLATARKIGGVSFDGSADVSLPGVNTAGNQNTSGKAATAGTADTANKLTTARKIGGVAFDGSADVSLPGVNIAGNQDTSGNARTAAKLQTARKINGVGFDGSSDITINPIVQRVYVDTDLFTLANGFYYFNGASATPNKPAGAGDWFVVEVAQNTNNGLMRLVDHNGLSFWTTKSAGKWGPWHRDADDGTVVHNTGNETISGTKTFTGQASFGVPPITTPDASGQVLIGRAGGHTKGLLYQVAADDVNGDLVGLGAGGTTIVGAGESTPNLINAIKAGKVPAAFGSMYNNGNAAVEKTIVASDSDVYIVTNYQNGGTSGSVVKVGADGYIYHWVNGAWVKSALVTDTVARANTATTTTGNSGTATKLQTARTIGGVSFNGTANINLPGVNTPGNQNTSGKAASAARADVATYATKANKADQLATARKIAGVSFDGTANIAIPAGNVGAYTKSQTDAKDTAKLASAKSYADAGDSATLTSAKSYADSGDSATLASAKSYADTGVKLGTEWMPLTMLNGYTSSNAEYTVIGKLVLFSGYFSAPAGSKGAATEIFKLPFSVKSGQYWMAEAPNGNGGVGTPAANLFPTDGTTINAWHAMDGKVYSLLGVWFTKI